MRNSDRTIIQASSSRRVSNRAKVNEALRKIEPNVSPSVKDATEKLAAQYEKTLKDLARQ